jgi:hypothetical protein
MLIRSITVYHPCYFISCLASHSSVVSCKFYSEQAAATPDKILQTQSSLSSRNMDLLGGYGSSSEDENQPQTTMVMHPLKVNSSQEEVWSEHFQKIKEFYEEKGHLSIQRKDPEILRLAQWLTYQRHQYKALRKDQLERLESINYNAVPMY